MKIKKRKKKLKKQELTNAQAAEVEILPPEEPEDSGWGNEGYEPASVSGGQAAGLPTRYDALTAYLREIRSYPRLTREQEQELALKYYHDRDLEAAYKLVKANLWLVVKIAREYQKAARSFLDLIQEGNIGLMEAVKNFDPYRG
ncbi:MAG: RNA polymerase subunit sigma-70, partial [Candidatus Dadabacteria bacterium]